MSGLLFLSSGDFHISKGANGPILCNTIRGLSLVLFYSKQCNHCQMLLPIFQNLPGSITGCQFGIINVSSDKGDIIRKSSITILPIEYVPLIILYVNMKPYMVYKGPYSINEIKRFIFDVYNNLNNKQKFSSTNQLQNLKKQNPYQQPTSFHKTTEFSLPGAIPLYGDNDNINYLAFDEKKGYHIIPQNDHMAKFNEQRGYFT